MPDSSVRGSQVVSRVGEVLRAVSTAGSVGATANEVAARCALTRPTAHRLLNSLAREGLLDQDGPRGRWFLGPELFVLGAVAAGRYDITDTARPHVRELARISGESAFLSARRGGETVCLLREEGSFPIRSFVLYEGVRFPLGVASAGLAILAFLNDVDAHVAGDALVARWGAAHSTAAIQERIAATRSAGYAVNPGLLVEGSWGMGAAVFDAKGEPAWALSLTGVESRFGPDRRASLGRLLLDRAHELTRELNDRRPSSAHA